MGGYAARRAVADPGAGDRSARVLRSAAPLLGRLERELDGRRGLILILDYDGTLAPIVSHPAAASLAPGVRAMLGRLARHPRARLAILSGRGLRDLRARVGVAGAVYAGCHGLEIRGPGVRFVHAGARAEAPVVATTSRALARGLARVPGALVEDKRLAVSVHYRRVSREHLAEVFDVVARVRRTAPDLGLLAGKEVLELLPRVGWDKGRAARLIARRLRPALVRSDPPLLVYAGDDTTDEAAFAALRGRAVTVRVGRRRRGAGYEVPDVRTLHAVLRWLRRALDRHR
jgi:trehalose-phosphatase